MYWDVLSKSFFCVKYFPVSTLTALIWFVFCVHPEVHFNYTFLFKKFVTLNSLMFIIVSVSWNIPQDLFLRRTLIKLGSLIFFLPWVSFDMHSRYILCKKIIWNKCISASLIVFLRYYFITIDLCTVYNSLQYASQVVHEKCIQCCPQLNSNNIRNLLGLS